MFPFDPAPELAPEPSRLLLSGGVLVDPVDGLLAASTLAVEGGRVADFGDGAASQSELPARRHDLSGRIVTPALIEPCCVLAAVPAPGEAVRTATEAADEEALFAAATPLVWTALSAGVGSIGLATLPGTSPDCALRQLRVARAIPTLYPIGVRALLSLTGGPDDAALLAAAETAGFVYGTAEIKATGAVTIGGTGVAFPARAIADKRLKVPAGSLLSGGGDPRLAPPALPLTAMTLARLALGWDWRRALAAMTWEAAAPLGLAEGTGRLQVGAPADLAVWDLPAPSALADWLSGPSPLVGLMLAGHWVLPYRPKPP